jgi:hypothetical protein
MRPARRSGGRVGLGDAIAEAVRETAAVDSDKTRI